MHEYGLNIGRLLDDYPDFTVMASLTGFGWHARYRTNKSSRGREIPGRTLNELAERMDAERGRRRELAEAEMLADFEARRPTPEPPE